MDNKECEFKYKCYYSNDDCGIIKDVCVHREKLMEIIKLGDQYNAVVAQNKSLQSELNVYKATARIMAERIKKDNQYADRLDRIIRVFRGQALQELEAENEH